MTVRKKLINLKDGRILSVMISGDESMAFPVLYFHGWPGSGLEASIFDQAARELGLTIVAVERPGLGESDFNSNRTVKSTIDDVEEMLQQLEINRIAVLAVSGGSAYGIFSSERFSDKVLSLTIVSGSAPPDKWHSKNYNPKNYKVIFWGVKKLPFAARTLLNLTMKSILMAPVIGLGILSRGFNKTDKNLLASSRNKILFQRNFLRAFHGGTSGAIKDLFLFINDWGLPEIKFDKPVSIWHGTDDTILPVEVTDELKEMFPQSELYILEGEGHFMLVALTKEVLSKVKESWS